VTEPGLRWLHIPLLAGEVSYLCSERGRAQLSRLLPTLCWRRTKSTRATQARITRHFPRA